METLIILKPDCLERKMQYKVLEVISKHFSIISSKSVVATREIVEEHYAEHKGKPFFEELVDFMSGNKVYVCLCQHLEEPENSVTKMRELVGPTDCSDSSSIRGKFKLRGAPKMKNLIHASDSAEAVLREKNIWLVEK